MVLAFLDLQRLLGGKLKWWPLKRTIGSCKLPLFGYICIRTYIYIYLFIYFFIYTYIYINCTHTHIYILTPKFCNVRPNGNFPLVFLSKLQSSLVTWNFKTLAFCTLGFLFHRRVWKVIGPNRQTAFQLPTNSSTPQGNDDMTDMKPIWKHNLVPRKIWRFFIQMLGCWWVFQPKKRCFKVWTPDTPDASKSLTTGRVGGRWRVFITEFGSSQSGWFSKYPILVYPSACLKVCFCGNATPAGS